LESNAAAIPPTYPEALRLAAALAEQNMQIEQQVQQAAPKVAFFDSYVDTAGSKSLRETAKVLNMPPQALTDALVRDGVLFRQSGTLLPIARHHHAGRFTVKAGIAASGHDFTQTRVTPRGVEWIAQRYASELMG
ncbi:Roi family DNA-binding protein, partial [Trabulsiella guamensis ATCC 49490]